MHDLVFGKKTYPTTCAVNPTLLEDSHSSFHLWQRETARNTTARDYGDRKDKRCILQMRLKRTCIVRDGLGPPAQGLHFGAEPLPSPLVSSSMDFAETRQQSPSCSVNEFEGPTFQGLSGEFIGPSSKAILYRVHKLVS